ncbi:hypothetical protein ACO0LB_16315 [Undibacterium sp. SXout7W]|uniref:hypothetical protein n=1 Tax=Undibacterium sp. SXout7W TaxID=3413049 RepID=UPI003BF02BE0
MPTHPLHNIEQTIATHAEKVSSKRLAKQQNISETAALVRVLQLSANKLQLDTVEQLAQWRLHEAIRITQLHAEKRRQKSSIRENKSRQIVLPDHVWHGWFDGSAKPNPGDCQIGCLLKGPNGERHTHQQRIGHGTSSDAEYQALIGTLRLARRHTSLICNFKATARS